MDFCSEGLPILPATTFITAGHAHLSPGALIDTANVVEDLVGKGAAESTGDDDLKRGTVCGRSQDFQRRAPLFNLIFPKFEYIFRT